MVVVLVSLLTVTSSSSSVLWQVAVTHQGASLPPTTRPELKEDRNYLLGAGLFEQYHHICIIDTISIFYF